jgi:hypothetical protein
MSETIKTAIIVSAALTLAYLFGMEVGAHAERLARARFDAAAALSEMRRAARAALEKDNESSDPATGDAG